MVFCGFAVKQEKSARWRNTTVSYLIHYYSCYLKDVIIAMKAIPRPMKFTNQLRAVQCTGQVLIGNWCRVASEHMRNPVRSMLHSHLRDQWAQTRRFQRSINQFNYESQLDTTLCFFICFKRMDQLKITLLCGFYLIRHPHRPRIHLTILCPSLKSYVYWMNKDKYVLICFSHGLSKIWSVPNDPMEVRSSMNLCGF